MRALQLRQGRFHFNNRELPHFLCWYRRQPQLTKSGPQQLPGAPYHFWLLSNFSSVPVRIRRCVNPPKSGVMGLLSVKHRLLSSHQLLSFPPYPGSDFPWLKVSHLPSETCFTGETLALVCHPPSPGDPCQLPISRPSPYLGLLEDLALSSYPPTSAVTVGTRVYQKAHLHLRLPSFASSLQISVSTPSPTLQPDLTLSPCCTAPPSYSSRQESPAQSSLPPPVWTPRSTTFSSTPLCPFFVLAVPTQEPGPQELCFTAGCSPFGGQWPLSAYSYPWMRCS